MRVTVLLAVAALLLLSACRPRGLIPRDGDAAPFILTTAVSLGGRPIATNIQASLGRDWRYLRDEYGVLIRLPASQFGATDAYIRSLFGAPQSSAGWAARDVGVAIYLQRVENETQIGFHPRMSREKLERAAEEFKKMPRGNGLDAILHR